VLSHRLVLPPNLAAASARLNPRAILALRSQDRGGSGQQEPHDVLSRPQTHRSRYEGFSETLQRARPCPSVTALGCALIFSRGWSVLRTLGVCALAGIALYLLGAGG